MHLIWHHQGALRQGVTCAGESVLGFLTAAARARSRKILMGSLKIPTCCCCNPLTYMLKPEAARGIESAMAPKSAVDVRLLWHHQGALRQGVTCAGESQLGAVELPNRARTLAKDSHGILENPNVLLLQHFDWFLSRFARIRFWSLPQASAGPQRSTTIAKDSHGILENPNVLLLQHFDWFLSRFARIRFWSLPQASAGPQRSTTIAKDSHGILENPNVLLLQHFDWFLSRFARIRFWSLPQASAGPQRSTTIAKDSHGILENPNVLLLQHFDWFLSRFARIRFWSLPQASAAPQTAAQRQHHHAATRPTFIVYSLFIVGVPGPGWSIGVYRFQFWYCRNECGQ